MTYNDRDVRTNVTSDRLWIYTGIAGSLFGAAFLAYFKDTRLDFGVMQNLICF